MNVLTTRPKPLEQIGVVVYLYVLKKRKVQNFLPVSSKTELKHVCHEVIKLLYFLNQRSRFSDYYGEKCTQNITTVVIMLCATGETTCATAGVRVTK